jgi:hypothetical protein
MIGRTFSDRPCIAWALAVQGQRCLVVGEEFQSDGDLKAGLSGPSRPSLVADYAVAGDAVPVLERLDCRGRTSLKLRRRVALKGDLSCGNAVLGLGNVARRI